MPIGTISNPANWVNGTIVAPSWLQNVQDNINGWIAGTGPTFKSLEIDGTGGLSSAISSGTLKVANGITISSGGLLSQLGITVMTGGALIVAGGVQVNAGGATITGNSSVTGTLAATSTVSGTIFTASSSISGTVPNSAPTAGAVYKDLIPLAWGAVSSNAITRSAGLSNFQHTGTGTYTATLSNSATNSAGLCPVASLFATGYFITSAGASANSVTFNTFNNSQVAADAAFFFVVYGG